MCVCPSNIIKKKKKKKQKQHTHQHITGENSEMSGQQYQGETNGDTTTMIVAATYLATHLIVPYFVTSTGEIKRPEHLIAWWSRIFSFFVPNEKDRIELRFLCRLFRDSLKPPPVWTSFPHPNYTTLDGLMNTLNSVYEEDPTKAPKIVFVMAGILFMVIIIILK